jgi:hypothetical protein
MTEWGNLNRMPNGGLVHKPNGLIHPGAHAVGPGHFAIISIDPAKDRSKWMMAGFYRRLLIEPTELEHHARGLQDAVEAIEQRIKKSAIRNVIVVIEHTEKLHRPCKRAFAAAGFEVRIVHPFNTKQFRQPAHPDNKGPGCGIFCVWTQNVGSASPGMGGCFHGSKVL